MSDQIENSMSVVPNLTAQQPDAEREWHQQFADIWDEMTPPPSDVWARQPKPVKLWRDK